MVEIIDFPRIVCNYCHDPVNGCKWCNFTGLFQGTDKQEDEVSFGETEDGPEVS